MNQIKRRYIQQSVTTQGSLDFTKWDVGLGVGAYTNHTQTERTSFCAFCEGEFRSCIQCGVFVCCYDEELFPQAQITSLCSWGVWLSSL